MGKTGLKSGAKLDLTARIGEVEHTLKTSFVKESGQTIHLSMPMANGKSVPLEIGTVLQLSWGEATLNSFDAVVQGTQKAGLRTYLVVERTSEVEKKERRSFVRVPAEIEVKLIVGQDGVKKREMRTFPGVTTNISNGGMAVYTDAGLAVGELISVEIPPDGKKKAQADEPPLKAAVCWTRAAPKGCGYRSAAGLQYFFVNRDEALRVATLVSSHERKMKW